MFKATALNKVDLPAPWTPDIIIVSFNCKSFGVPKIIGCLNYLKYMPLSYISGKQDSGSSSKYLDSVENASN